MQNSKSLSNQDRFDKSLSNQDRFDNFLELYLLWCPLLDSKVAAFLSAQSALETGWYESQVYRQNNNLFGMRLPKFRVTTAVGSKLNHAFYTVEYDSFVDYLLWMSTFGFSQVDLKDLDRFLVKFRKSPFNSSEKYVDTILEIFKTYYHDK